tara:strand:+ start:188 stop:1045 length:858 start_codon:yes stop_codon:yes gene_type:complete
MKKKILKISILGKTNAGKSTLLNNIVGENISIINKKINTTEDLIIGVLNIKNHQIIFYDTPGINYLKKNNKNKTKLKQNLWNGINESDIIIYLVDLKTYNFDNIINDIYKLNEVNKKIIVVFNKNDQIEKKSILPKIKEINNLNIADTFFSISAKKKLGIKNLVNYLINESYDSEWYYNDNEISNKDDIFITNEITRNSILSLLNKEIPYNVKIINKQFLYLNNGDLKIKQNINISNYRYKKIILGKNGEKIKDIRIRSQKEISKTLNSKVHLYINVVQSNAKKI